MLNSVNNHNWLYCSTDVDEKCVIHSKSNNIEFSIW